MAWDFYTGPVGRMRRMPTVDSGGVTTTRGRLAALQQSLGGAYTRDTFTIKKSWAWSWPYLGGADLASLELLTTTGPLALVDPMENRFGADLASAGSVTRTGAAFVRSGNGPGNYHMWRYSGSADQAPGVAAQGVLVWNLVEANGFERLDATTSAPAVANDPPPEAALIGEGEPTTISVWLRCPPTVNIAFGALTYGSQYNPRAATEVLSGYQVGTGDWQQRTLTLPATTGVAGVVPRLVAIPSAGSGTTTVEVSGLMVEPAPSPTTAWLPGSGQRYVLWDVPGENYLVGGGRAITVTAQEV